MKKLPGQNKHDSRPNYNDINAFSVMKNFDPKENLKKEYDDKLSYNYWISASIAQGEHELVSQFLKKVPDSDKKGNEAL